MHRPPPTNYNSNIKDQWSQSIITNVIIIKSLKYYKNYKIWHKDTNYAEAVGKFASVDLLDMGLQ